MLPKLEIQQAIERYDQLFPNEVSVVAHFAELNHAVSVSSRRNSQGHITGSAYVVDLTAQKILLIFHRGLQRWLQPGGHLEEAEMPWIGAAREAREETGVQSLSLLPWHAQNANAPLDFEVHTIPKNIAKGEPQHFHYDFRYVFFSKSNEVLKPQLEEVAQARWFGFADAVAYLGQRPIDKLRAL